MRLIHIEEGKVVNISTGELIETQNMFPSQLIVDGEGQNANIGWSYLEGLFTPPEAVPEALLAPIITRLAFRNRFTAAEKVALYTAAETNVLIKIYLDDLSAATFIDLTREDTRNGVLNLEAAGLLASGRALEILDSPVQKAEVWKSGT